MKRLPKLLKRAYLGGVVEECVLTSNEEGFAYIQAVDMSNTIFIDVASEIPLPAMGKLGLCDMSKLIRFFDSFKDSELDIKLNGNRLTVTAAPHGRLNFLLMQADLVPTVVEDTDSMSKLLSLCTHSIPITAQQSEDILTYLKLLAPKAITLHNTPEGVLMSGGLESEHQFDLPLGMPTLGENCADSQFAVSIYAEKLAAVLSVLEWMNGSPPPKLHFAAGRPVLVEQDQDNLWALVPVTLE